MLQTRVVWRPRTTTPQNGKTRGQYGCGETRTGYSFHQDKYRDESVREVGPHTPHAPRKTRQKSGPRTMDGTPEVGNRGKRRNHSLLEKTGPGGRGRLTEPRKPDSRQGKMEEPYQENKSGNDGMGEANERVEEGRPQAVTELSTSNGKSTALSMARLQNGRW